MKILVIGPSWVGDMVMAQTLFKVLDQRHPNLQLDVLALAWSRPILEAMPEVSNAIDMPVGHGKLQWSTRKAVAERLKSEGYDQAIVLPNSLKSALIPWFAGIPTRTGWKGEMRYGLLNDIRKLDESALPLMVQRFVALGYPKGQENVRDIPPPRLKVASDLVKASQGKFGITLKSQVLGLCPGAEFGAAKQWPAEHYAEVASEALKGGKDVWLFGSANDKPVCDDIIERLGGQGAGVRNLAGATSLEECVALLSLTDQVVSNDSGLMHVAAALGKAVVVVYGSTSPEFTPPLTDRAEIVRLGLECSPCFDRTCRFGHYHCLTQLPPSQVLAALKRLESGTSDMLARG